MRAVLKLYRATCDLGNSGNTGKLYCEISECRVSALSLSAILLQPASCLSSMECVRAAR